MTDKSTPTKKDFLSNEKTSNNQSTSTNIINPETAHPPLNIINSNETFQNKNTQNFTFKIIKRRAPWNKKEDEAIIELVNKYGTSNWTIIANEMALMYKSKHRNGKQCRERWHNHLDPIVNKENWTEEEENILFNKHMEYGNKWSDISKFLPGRTDNSIKNHFYSKLRKYIRKILKQINKENLLKNNGIDYYKYNSDKVYKLLKKYKITYKNVNKDTILNLIIATEKNQKGKIFGLNEEKQINNNNLINDNNIKNNEILNTPFILDNNLINNTNDKQNRNNSGSKIMKNTLFNKKTKIKSKLKSDDINGNPLLLKKDKKIFQSSIVTDIKPIKDDLLENKNKTILLNSNNNEVHKTVRKYKRKNKGSQNTEEKNNIQNENNINENNIISNENGVNNSKKKLSINPDFIQQTYKFKNKSKSKIKVKENNIVNNKYVGKKRRRKKRRKVTISLSTPENKKTQINRIMPGRKYIFGLGQRLPIKNKIYKKNKKNKFDINPEDFDPTINEVEIIRDGLEIHSKSIILINKSLLTQKLFPDMNYNYKPNLNLNIAIPPSPKIQQFPSCSNPKTMKNAEEMNYITNYYDRNISIGLPTPMNACYEPQISPMGNYNILMYPPPSNKNIYNVDFGAENHFFRKNFPNPYTPKGYANGSILTPNTPKKEINLQNKILVQNNSNIIDGENHNFQENIKKPEALNMDLIDNYNNEINNENNNGYPIFPIFGGNENIGSSVAKQMPTPANIFNLSPKSPFIPRTFGDKNL